MTAAPRPLSESSAQAKRERVAALLRERASEQRSSGPLSHGQQALWFLHQSAPESCAYHVAFSARIRGALDAPVLRRALQRLLERHGALRALFRLQDGAPLQEIAGSRELHFELQAAAGCGEAELAERVRAAHERPFDLERGPLLRASLFACGAQDHVLLLSVHHIAIDGWSLWLCVDELGALYSAEVNGARAALVPPALRYADWVQRERAALAGPEGERLWSYWKRELAGELPALNLPIDRPRPALARYRGASCRRLLGGDWPARIRAAAQRHGVTPFMLLLAAYQVLLHRYSGQPTVLVGSPSAGRSDPALAGVVGYFVNPLVLRAELGENPSFAAFLQQVRRSVLGALEHQGLPFPLLVERLRPRRDPARSPLFQASFVLQQPPRAGAFAQLLAASGSARSVAWGGNLVLQPFEITQQEGQFELELELLELGDGWHAWFKYDRDLFEAASIERLAGHFEVLLDAALREPEREVAGLALLGDAERCALLRAARSRRPVATPALTLDQLVAQQAQRSPGATAVVCGDRALTYAELDARANQLAHELRALGVGREARVGLLTERSLELVVGMLGALRAGAAYVPLDPSWPAERFAFILADSRVSALLTQSALAERVPALDCPQLRLDADWERIARRASDSPPPLAGPDSLAYVIYTSGSTGTPKGVQITHFNALRLFSACQGWYEFGPGDVWTLFHSAAFDFSVWEIWGALLYGGRLVVVPYWVSREPARFLELLAAEHVTVLNQTPSAFHQLMAADEARAQPLPLALRWVIFGGEALDPRSLRGWFARRGESAPRLVNMYGITETTVHVSYRPLCAADAESARSLIGEPLPDLEIHLLDAQLEPVPPGVTGEMYIAGDGLARGYLERPELDRQRFLEIAGMPGEPPLRLYRSGDLARRLPDGDLEYLGRCDQQIKLRGFRIELGEIGAALQAEPGVRAACAALRADPRGEPQLVAYVAADPRSTPAPALLREALRARLPGYMVPAAFAFLEQLPLNHNAKLDQRALAALELDWGGAGEAAAPPRDALERALLACFERVLGRPLGVRDDFFDCGGHSVLAVSLVAQIERSLGRALPLAALFQHSSVESLAALLRASGPLPRAGALVAIQSRGSGTPFFCAAGGGGSVLCFHALSRHLGEERPFYGLQAYGLDGECEPLTRVEDIAERQLCEVREVQPHGPYLLGGHCFGGLVAYEMAQQLLRAGESVALVALFDVPAPRGSLGAAAPAGADAHDDAFWLAKLAEVMGEAVAQDLGVRAEALRALAPPAQLRHFQERMEAVGLLPPGAPPGQVRGLLRVFMANSRTRYAPRGPWPVPVALFRARTAHADYDYSAAEDRGRPREHSTLGWGALAGGSASVDFVAGTHVTMLSEPHVQELAERLALRLRSSSGALSSPRGLGGAITSLTRSLIPTKENHS